MKYEVPDTQPATADQQTEANDTVGEITAETTYEEDSPKDTNEVTTSLETGGGAQFPTPARNSFIS